MENFTRTLTMLLVLIFLKGMTSGQRVETHNNEKIFTARLRPTQSLIILLKRSSKAGIYCN